VREKGKGRRKEGAAVTGGALFKPAHRGGGRAGGWCHAVATRRGGSDDRHVVTAGAAHGQQRWNGGGGCMVSVERKGGKPLMSGPERHSPGRRGSI
jgi:hypothetical protein